MQSASSASDGDDENSSGGSSSRSGSSSSESGSDSSRSSGDSSSGDSNSRSRDDGQPENKDNNEATNENRIRKNSIPTTITVNTESATTTTEFPAPASAIAASPLPEIQTISRKRKRLKRHNIHVPFQYPYESHKTHRQKLSVSARRFKKRKVSRETKTRALMQALAPLQGQARIDAIQKILMEKQGENDLPGEIPRGMLSSSSEDEGRKVSGKRILGKWEEENEFVGEMNYHRRDWIREGRGWRGRRAVYDTIAVEEISDLVGWATSYSGGRKESASSGEKKGDEEKTDKDGSTDHARNKVRSELTSSFAIPSQQDLLHHPTPPPPPSNLTFLAECTAQKVASNITHIKNNAFDRERIKFEKQTIQLNEDDSSSSSSSSSHSSHNSDEEDSTYKLLKSHKPLKSAQAWVPVQKTAKRGGELTPEEKMKLAKLRSMYRAFDNTALVALGMAAEEVLTAALMPLARAHVARCRMLERRERWKRTQEGEADHERCSGHGICVVKDATTSSNQVTEARSSSNLSEGHGDGEENDEATANYNEKSNVRPVDSLEDDGLPEGSNGEEVDIEVTEKYNKEQNQENDSNDNNEGNGNKAQKVDIILDVNDLSSRGRGDMKSHREVKMYEEERGSSFDAWTLPPTEAIVGLVPFLPTFPDKQNKTKGIDGVKGEALSYLPSSLPPSISCDQPMATANPNATSDLHKTSDVAQCQDELEIQMASSSLRWCKKHKLRSDLVSKNMELYELFLPAPPKKEIPVDYLSVSQRLPPLGKSVGRSKMKRR